jgi:hypothetical protein
MNFLYEEKENSPNQHCLSSQDANMGTIWSHLNKLCHGCDKKKLALFFIEKEKEKSTNHSTLPANQITEIPPHGLPPSSHLNRPRPVIQRAKIHITPTNPSPSPLPIAPDLNPSRIPLLHSRHSHNLSPHCAATL